MPRPPSEAFSSLQFTLVRGPNSRYNAFCEVCKKTLCNTATARLKAHRNRCQPDKDESMAALNLISSHPTSSKLSGEVTIDCSKNRDPLSADFVSEDNNSNIYRADSRYEDLDVNMQIVDVETVTRDECLAFGQYVSTQLRKMDSRTCALVKYKICETLYNAEIGVFSKEEDV